MRKRGFTLVELLVVIAIIAILAAMIVPVLLEAKEAAKMRRCVSNLRQLGMCISMYMDDHAGFGLPVDRTPASEGVACDNPWVLYVKPLASYIRQNVPGPRPTPHPTPHEQLNAIFVCSGDICRGTGLTDNDRPCWWAMGSSYMYPGPTAYVTKAATDIPGDNYLAKDLSCVPLRPMAWRCQRRDILLADFWSDYHSGYRVKRNYSDPNGLLPGSTGGKRDVKCMNVVFLDLHAEAVTPDRRDDLILDVRQYDNPYWTQPQP